MNAYSLGHKQASRLLEISFGSYIKCLTVSQGGLPAEESKIQEESFHLQRGFQFWNFFFFFFSFGISDGYPGFLCTCPHLSEGTLASVLLSNRILLIEGCVCVCVCVCLCNCKYKSKCGKRGRMGDRSVSAPSSFLLLKKSLGPQTPPGKPHPWPDI